MKDFKPPPRTLDFYPPANEEKLLNDCEQRSHMVNFVCYKSNYCSSDSKD